MDEFEIADELRPLRVDIAGKAFTLGQLVDLDTPALGMEILHSMHESGKESWSAPNMAAHAQSSVNSSQPRVSGRPLHQVGSLIPAVISEGMSWLIAGGLLGPAAWSSGAGSEWTISKAGHLALESGTSRHVEARRRLGQGLHSRLRDAALYNFERGNYEVAVFAAMKEVEVALRSAAGFGPDKYGRQLVTDALRVGSGTFVISDETPAEQEGFLQLFLGAVTAFKNPSSHRTVEYSDPDEAADIVHLADLLLRVIDREVANRVAAASTAESDQARP